MISYFCVILLAAQSVTGGIIRRHLGYQYGHNDTTSAFPTASKNATLGHGTPHYQNSSFPMIQSPAISTTEPATIIAPDCSGSPAYAPNAPNTPATDRSTPRAPIDIPKSSVYLTRSVPLEPTVNYPKETVVPQTTSALPEKVSALPPPALGTVGYIADTSGRAASLSTSSSSDGAVPTTFCENAAPSSPVRYGSTSTLPGFVFPTSSSKQTRSTELRGSTRTSSGKSIIEISQSRYDGLTTSPLPSSPPSPPTTTLPTLPGYVTASFPIPIVNFSIPLDFTSTKSSSKLYSDILNSTVTHLQPITSARLPSHNSSTSSGVATSSGSAASFSGGYSMATNSSTLSTSILSTLTTSTYRSNTGSVLPSALSTNTSFVFVPPTRTPGIGYYSSFPAPSTNTSLISVPSTSSPDIGYYSSVAASSTETSVVIVPSTSTPGEGLYSSVAATSTKTSFSIVLPTRTPGIGYYTSFAGSESSMTSSSTAAVTTETTIGYIATSVTSVLPTTSSGLVVVPTKSSSAGYYPSDAAPSSYTSTPAVIIVPTSSPSADYSSSSVGSLSSTTTPAVVVVPTQLSSAGYAPSGAGSSSFTTTPAIIVVPTETPSAGYSSSVPGYSSSTTTPAVVVVPVEISSSGYSTTAGPSSSTTTPAVVVVPIESTAGYIAASTFSASHTTAPAVVVVPIDASNPGYLAVGDQEAPSMRQYKRDPQLYEPRIITVTVPFVIESLDQPSTTQVS